MKIKAFIEYEIEAENSNLPKKWVTEEVYIVSILDGGKNYLVLRNKGNRWVNGIHGIHFEVLPVGKPIADLEIIPAKDVKIIDEDFLPKGVVYVEESTGTGKLF